MSEFGANGGRPIRLIRLYAIPYRSANRRGRHMRQQGLFATPAPSNIDSALRQNWAGFEPADPLRLNTVRIFQIIDFPGLCRGFPPVLFTVVSPNSLRFRCGFPKENGSSRLAQMDQARTDLVYVARLPMHRRLKSRRTTISNCGSRLRRWRCSKIGSIEYIVPNARHYRKLLRSSGFRVRIARIMRNF
jgi:hypothetical protein